MQVCLMIEGQEGVTWSEWVAIARACEEHGIETLFRSDHYLNLDGLSPERPGLDAWATIAGLAAMTTSLRLGTLVSPATFRHPSVLAKQVTTADHISDGRVELGIGAGWHEREHEAYGFSFPAVRERMDRLAEQIEIVHRHWEPGPFSFAGRYFTVRELDAQPKPIQRPHPPLLMGGAAGPRAAALAARWADEYNTTYPTIAAIYERRGRLAQACAEIGRDPIPLSMMTAVIPGANRADLVARVGRIAERIDADAAQLLSAPPDGWIVGTVEEVAEQLAAYAEAGVTRVMCQHLDHADLEAIALLGREVAPLVAA